MTTETFDFALHPAQSVIHNSPARFKVVAAGRRFGKSYYAAIMCIAEVMKSEHVGRSGKVYQLDSTNDVWYVAPYFKQAKDIFEEKIKTMARPLISKYNSTEGIITFINGRKLKLKGADNAESLRGIGLSYVVMDEYADMPGNVWNEIIRATLMDVEGGALFIGTPKGKNHFYDLFQKGEEEYAARGDKAEWRSFSYTSYENSELNQQEIRTTEEDQGTDFIRKQEIHAKFLAMGGGDLDPERLILQPVEPEDGYYVVTADLAGFTSPGRSRTKERRDNSAIVTTKVHPGGWWINTIDYGRWDVRETAVRLARTAVKHNVPYVGIEKGISRQAVEPYFNDYCMKLLRRNIQIFDLSHGNQKKQDRINWSMSARLKNGEVQVNADSFGQHQWVMQVRQEMSDFPDERSPDDLIDAISYVDQMPRMAFEIPEVNDYLEVFDEAIGY